MGIELILKKDVPSVGKLGEVVSVAPGFARNYLLPRGLAVKMTAANARQLEFDAKKAAKQREIELAEIRALANKLASVSCTIAAKANEEGHLYGSIDAGMVADALKKEGYDIGAKAVQLPEPLKELGVFSVKLALAEGIEAEIKLWVVEDKGEAQAAEGA